MTTNIEIRACAPGDERALALIGQATFLETFAGVLDGASIISHCERAHATGAYREWLVGAKYGAWLCEVAPGNAPVGYLVTAPAQLPLPDADPADREIKRIYVLGKFQGGGLGKRLVLEAIADARARAAARILLGVHDDNHAAIGFYLRLGFRRLGRRTFNVGDRGYGDDIMGLSL